MLKKYPFVKQEGIKDCGCACLLMIIKYYKGNVSIERLRDLTHTNKNGTSAYNLVKTSIDLGFDARGVKATLDDFKNVLFPCIAHVVIDNVYKHYIVIYDVLYNENKLLIADPANGIKKVSFDYFNNIWTGILIILYPCRSLPIDKSINVNEFIFKNIFKHKKILFILFLLSIFVIFIKIISSFYFKFIIDGIDVSKNLLKSVFVIFLLLYFMKNITNYLRNKLLIILNCRLDFSLVLDAFKRVILLPYRYYHNRTTGEIISKINDLQSARDFISKICVSLFIDFPLVIVSAIFLLYINFKLFFISFIIFLLYLVLSILYSKVYRYYINRIKVDKEIVNSYMYESINGFETVHGINIQDKVIDMFNHKYLVLLNNVFKLQNHINNQVFFKDIINDFGNVFVLFFGALLVFDDKFSIGYLITYSSMLSYFFEPIRNIIDMDVNIKESHEAIRRVISLYENYSDRGLIGFKFGNINFKNLNFSFDNKSNVLNSVNLSICKGEHVMIYGASGSGKSTLLKLLMKYYEIGRDNIYIDGIDINDYKTISLRKNISYISQNEMLFNDTLINNLKFYSGDNNEILNVARIFELDEIVDNDLGFNMMIEENGFNLSGGQRQRIVLARTFLKKSPIVLIDEGFSQIDVEMERRILTRVFDMYKDKTIVIISHRMENLDLYDRLIKIVDGGVFIDEKNL